MDNPPPRLDGPVGPRGRRLFAVHNDYYLGMEGHGPGWQQLASMVEKYWQVPSSRSGRGSGGGPISEQCIQLQEGCDVLIGTPGRLCETRLLRMMLECPDYARNDRAWVQSHLARRLSLSAMDTVLATFMLIWQSHRSTEVSLIQHRPDPRTMSTPLYSTKCFPPPRHIYTQRRTSWSPSRSAHIDLA